MASASLPTDESGSPALVRKRFEDPAAMHGFVADILGPYAFDVPDRRVGFDGSVAHLRAERVSFNVLSYNGPVAIDPGALRDSYVIQVQLAGEETIYYDSRAYPLSQGAVSVFSPGVPLRKTSLNGKRKLVVRLDRQLVENACVRHLGRDLREPLRFDPLRSSCEGQTRALRELVVFLNEQLANTPGLASSPWACRSVEETLAASLLLLQANNYSAALQGGADEPCAPTFLKRAERYLEEHADRPVTIDELAQQTGVSPRSLYAAYRRYRGTTPMAHLRELRLERAREVLLAATDVSVAEVARRWGFTHLGRFAEQYRKRFGETPSMSSKRRIP